MPLNVSLTDTSGRVFPFSSAAEIVVFLDEEIKFWKAKAETLVSPDKKIHQSLNASSALEQVKAALASYDESVTEPKQLRSMLGPFQAAVNNLTNAQWLWSGHPYNAGFVETHTRFGQRAAHAFLDAVARNAGGGGANELHQLYGIVSAHQFVGGGPSRQEGERASFDHLRQQLVEATGSAVRDAEAAKLAFLAWKKEAEDEWSNALKGAIDAAETNLSDSKETFGRTITEQKDTVSALEQTYASKLRLEKPAEYWSRSAEKHGKQAFRWLVVLLSFVAIGLGFLCWFYIAWLHGKSIGLRLDTVQGVVIFGTLLAVYAFALNIISRLLLSSYHLMRDSEEREQLTYLYLSLVNERALDQSALEIVLQALFSRSETGLLKGESGPTMPIVGELLRSAAKAKSG